MMIELRDLISMGALLVALLSVILVSRNSRRATTVNAQAVDLTRIRDLRHELGEAKSELDSVKKQVTDLARQLTEASDAATQAYRDRAEMLRYARMPGVTLEDWLARFDTGPAALNGRMDG